MGVTRQENNGIFEFWKYKGKRLIDIPASYFLYLHEGRKIFGRIKKYIDENLDAFKLEIEKEKFTKESTERNK